MLRLVSTNYDDSLRATKGARSLSARRSAIGQQLGAVWSDYL
jgi:hypothetical protein